MGEKGERMLITSGGSHDIAQMLALLHELEGAAFSRQVESIALHAVFTPYKSEANILIAGGEQKHDFDNLLNAARKAVSHGSACSFFPTQREYVLLISFWNEKGSTRCMI